MSTELSTFQNIKLDVADKILTITISNPGKRNAFGGDMSEGILYALDVADADDDIRVVIFTGDPAGRAFSSGIDVALGAGKPGIATNTADLRVPLGGCELQQIDWRDERLREAAGRLSLRIFNSKKPVIGAINGPAMGMGVTVPCAMDMRLAAQEARFGFVFAKRGLTAEGLSNWFLPRLVGLGKTFEWFLTGRDVPAQEALEAGLVHSVHTQEELIPATRALAKQIVANVSPVAAMLVRQMLLRLDSLQDPMDVHRLESYAVFATLALGDVAEGMRAFMEKRPARFPAKVSGFNAPWYPWWTDSQF
jgi:enoyl-CoA hydratase/carnithine racemase